MVGTFVDGAELKSKGTLSTRFTSMEDTSSPGLRIDPDDLEMAVRASAHQWSSCKLVSTARAVEELRIRTGDFVSTDKELANAVSVAALADGYAVLMDEAVGPGSTP
jgi:hypothetical protein